MQIQPTQQPAFGDWRARALIGSVATAALAYLAFALWGGWQQVLDASLRVGLLGIMATLLLSLVNYGLRFLRWQLYFSQMGYEIEWRSNLQIYLAGFALTTTPGKAGEAIRAVFLKARAVPYAASLAAFFSERLSDLTAILLLALLAMNAFGVWRPVIAGAIVLVMVCLLLLSNGRWLEWGQKQVKQTSKVAKLLHSGFDLAKNARRCHSPGLLIKATGLSLVAWFAEAWALHLILQWMHLDLPVSIAVFIYSTAMIAGALSFLPGGVGGVEVVMVSLLVWNGVSTPDAIAASILIRLVTLWFAVLLGLITIAFGRDSLVAVSGAKSI